ncbi:MAG: 16S rRNA (cytosine(967)-C(5))-methyltransferase RsmB [Clostridia bacterium]|nr:16S rRNA (cytosine(967)-C(5))-methyltransferase RsmB [Clostridia bacterium]
MRKIALNILTQTEQKDAYLNLVFEEALKNVNLSSLDVGFVKELVFGVFRNKILLDYIIRKNSSIRLKKIDPKILNILRCGAYQLLFMDKVPNHAAVDESVKLAKKCSSPKTTSYVNGVLRGIIRTCENGVDLKDIKDETEKLSVKYSYPKPLAEFFVKDFGNDAERLMAAGNKTPELCVRVNTLKTTKEEFKEKLDELDITYRDTPYTDCGLYLFGATTEKRKGLEGLFTVQDQSSQLAALSLSPEPDSLVLDLCAAPGGKTTHLAELMKNQGKIIATDIYETRLKSVAALAEKLGISIIETKVQDASIVDPNLVSKADYILADVPCSGLGIIRRKPDIKYKENITDFTELNEIQQKILDAAYHYLKQGGIMVYSTCTVNKGENIEMINNFLKTHPDMALDKIKSPHITGDVVKNEGYLEIFPHIHNSDGFFVCRIKKQENV